ncbi:MAG: hypothetical protein NPIRA02_32610 [Nitrospirales bacterium]|nr:MAG: hypothetical protein NPIRA02_32610 [Nitrospirales bacterium]
MKLKSLLMLTGITLMVTIGALLLNQERQDRPEQNGKLFFPDLMNRINDIRTMTIETKDGTVTLVRESSTWSVQERAGYTAAVEKIKPVLIGMAELRIREPKTKNPELHEKLGLLNHDAEGSSSTLLTLKTEDAEPTASVLVGNQRLAKSASTKSELYVRKPDETQTWLVAGNLPILKLPEEWLNNDLLTVANKRVQRVRVTHADGEILTVYKDTPDALDFKIDGLPNEAKVNSQFNVNNVATTLAQLTMEDVRKSDAFEFSAKNSVKAVLETFDGLRLTVETMPKDDVTFGKIAAAFDPALVYKEPVNASSEQKERVDAESDTDSEKDETESDKGDNTDQSDQTKNQSEPKESILKSEEDVQTEVAEINGKLNDWIFELPKFKVDNFAKKKQDLIAAD